MELIRVRNTINVIEKKVTNAYFATKNENNNTLVFEKLEKVTFGDTVYIIIETENLNDVEIQLNVKQGKEKVFVEKEKAIFVQQNDKQVKLIKTKVGNYSDKKEYTNSSDFKDIAIAEVTLAPKEEKEQKEYAKALKDKKAYLFLDLNVCTEIDNQAKFYKNGKEDKSDTPYYYLNTKEGWLELNKKTPVIILDPGHGFKGGNVGAQSRKYKYKIKGEDGKAKLDNNKNFMTDLKDVMSLPDYVIKNPEEWIIGDNESKNHKYDNNRTEYKITYNVALKMKEMLNLRGYKNVFLTRTNKEIKQISGNKLAYRIDIANDKKADYFISIHADGSKNFKSGAHSIYSSTDNVVESKKIATDIMKYYTVVEVEKDSPKKDIRGLRVLRTTNKTKRKTLVELGFLTSPSDAKKLFSNIDLIAEQLVKGLILNIKETNF